MTELDPTSTWSLNPKKDYKKLYHNWSYDPKNDSATIDQGKTGEDHGYAYRIGGGWRILDIDHKKTTDPRIRSIVLDALKGTTEKSGEPKDYDFDILHYGQPAEITSEVELGEENGID